MKTILILVAALCLLAACNTIEGVGKDVKKAGSTIEDAAKKR